MDYLVGIAITLGISFVSSFIMAIIKKGQFETWGRIVGRLLSKVGNQQLGRNKWEKLEDVITLAILSFAKGVKLGADEDDDGKLDRIEHHLEHGKKIDFKK